MAMPDGARVVKNKKQVQRIELVWDRRIAKGNRRKGQSPFDDVQVAHLLSGLLWRLSLFRQGV